MTQVEFQPGDAIDLGHGHTLTWASWVPDRDLNPQYEGMADIEKCTAVIHHQGPDGEPCRGAFTPDTEATCRLFPEQALWQVICEDPLTVSPSILCHCGDHGFIQGGRWVPA